MADAYIGEIRMFAGNYPPQDWAFCDGQLLSIAQNEILFAVIGTTYGGDGVNNFALPDLRGRIAVNQGQGEGLSNRVIGQKAGAEQVTLSVGQLPSHSHPLNIKTAAGDITSPANAIWAANDHINQYSSNPPNGLMNSAAISSTGNNVAHENMMPYLCISFIICLQNGIFPNRN